MFSYRKKQHAFFSHFFFLPFFASCAHRSAENNNKVWNKTRARQCFAYHYYGWRGRGKTEPFPRTKEKEKRGKGWLVGAVFFISGEKGGGRKICTKWLERGCSNGRTKMRPKNSLNMCKKYKILSHTYSFSSLG